MPKTLTKQKKKFFYLLTVGLVIFIPLACFFGFFAFRKLTFSYDYCGSYGKLDEELGWKLKENASSCLSLNNFLTGETYFDSKIYTNNLGFRDIETNRDVPKGAITAIGDSWTFGYGINYEETFPYLLSQQIDFPVVNMGIPAYGSGSTLLLFERYVEQIHPPVVIYFTHGFWTRSLCLSQTKPSDNLIPCFWWDDQNKQIELIKPPPGKVFEEAKKHSYPGGALTAGYNNWEYFLIIKPLMMINSIKTSALNTIKSTWGLKQISPTAAKINRATVQRKLKHMRNEKYSPESDDAVAFAQIDSVLKYTLRRYARLAKEYGFILLMVDNENFYKPYLEEAKRDFGVSIIHIGANEYEKEIEYPGSKLPPKLRNVPKDGHYAVGFNRLIAKKIARSLEKSSILSKVKQNYKNSLR